MTHKDTNTRMFTIEYTAAPLAASGAPTRTSVTTGLLDNSGLGLCIIGDTTYMTSRPDRVGGNAVISVKGTSMGVIKGTDSYTYEWTGGQLGYPVCDEDAGLVFFTYTSAWDKNPYPRETVLLQTPTGGGGVEEVLTAPAFLSSPPYKTEPGGLLPQFALVRGFPGIVYTGDVASNGRTATNAPDGVFLAENDGANPLAKSSKVWEGGSQVGPIVWMPNGVPPPSAKPTAKPQAADTEAPTVGQSTEAPSKPAPGATDSPTTTAPPSSPNTGPPTVPGTASPTAPAGSPTVSPVTESPTDAAASPTASPVQVTATPSNGTAAPSVSPSVGDPSCAERTVGDLCMSRQGCLWVNGTNVCLNETCPVAVDSPTSCVEAYCEWMPQRGCLRRGRHCPGISDADSCLLESTCLWRAERCSWAPYCNSVGGSETSCLDEDGCGWTGASCTIATPAPTTDLEKKDVLSTAILVLIILASAAVLFIICGLMIRCLNRRRRKEKPDEGVELKDEVQNDAKDGCEDELHGLEEDAKAPVKMSADAAPFSKITDRNHSSKESQRNSTVLDIEPLSVIRPSSPKEEKDSPASKSKKKSESELLAEIAALQSSNRHGRVHARHEKLEDISRARDRPRRVGRHATDDAHVRGSGRGALPPRRGGRSSPVITSPSRHSNTSIASPRQHSINGSVNNDAV
eukprot:Hpha_TRINITY_DN16594_c2_g3::TRINITY_DN16594_c2_g3_i2::g.136642::m.136642